MNDLLTRNRQPTTIEMVTNLRLSKRSIAMEVIFGTCVSNFIMSIFEPLVPWSGYHKIKEMKEFQEHEAAKLEKFKGNFNESLAIQNGMLDLIIQNARSIRDQQRQLAFITKLSAEVTWLSPLISTRSGCSDYYGPAPICTKLGVCTL